MSTEIPLEWLERKGQDIEPEIRKALECAVGHILRDDWGSSRSKLFLDYLQTTVIPDLCRFFTLNAHVLDHPLLPEILAHKLSGEHGYPSGYVNSLAADLLGKARETIPRATTKSTAHEPWERIMRLITIGESIPGLTRLTGFSPTYIELLWRQFLEYRDNPQAALRAGIPANRCRFFNSFIQRLQEVPFAQEYMIAEQAIFDLGLPITPDQLISFLSKIYMGGIVHGHAAVVSLFYRQYSTIPEIDRFVPELQNYGLVRQGDNLELTPRGARMVSPIIANQLLTIIERGSDRPEAAEEWQKMLLALPTEVFNLTVEGLVRSQATHSRLILTSRTLPSQKHKLLKLLWAWGEINNQAARQLLIAMLKHKDGLISFP